MRAASCTPLPEKFLPTCVAPDAWTPMRTFGANPADRRCSASRRWIATAHASAWSGESNPTKKPSPVATTSSPSCSAKSVRSVASCQRRTPCQASSPNASTRFVEPSMSVNMNVFSTRRGASLPRSCQGSSSCTSSTVMAPVGQARAASRSSSSSTLAGSMTPAFAKSPWCQSNAVGAIVMQVPAPMHR